MGDGAVGISTVRIVSQHVCFPNIQHNVGQVIIYADRALNSLIIDQKLIGVALRQIIYHNGIISLRELGIRVIRKPYSERRTCTTHCISLERAFHRSQCNGNWTEHLRKICIRADRSLCWHVDSLSLDHDSHCWEKYFWGGLKAPSTNLQNIPCNRGRCAARPASEHPSAIGYRNACFVQNRIDNRIVPLQAGDRSRKQILYRLRQFFRLPILVLGQTNKLEHDSICHPRFVWFKRIGIDHIACDRIGRGIWLYIPHTAGIAAVGFHTGGNADSIQRALTIV